MSDRQAMSETHDCGGDAAAYVLGALEPTEAEAFRRHLMQCAVCRDEVDTLSGVVDALPMAAPQVQPPKRLRRRVLRAVRSQPRPSATGSRRSTLRSPRPAVALLGAALLAAGAVFAGVELSAGGPTTRVVQARVSGISGDAQLRVNDAHGELIVRGLTPPPPGDVYEVWLKFPGASPVPASVLFSVNSTGAADVSLPRGLRGVAQVMVTPEPQGGSPTPTHTPVIVASLT